MTTSTQPPAESEGLTWDQVEAEKVTGLSYKTLERHALAGEPVGRVKVGRRVLFIRSKLREWLLSKLPAAN